MSNNLVCLFYSFNDGMLEVMGIYSSFHIAQLQVGLADPIRLGQAKIVKVRAHSAYKKYLQGSVVGKCKSITGKKKTGVIFLSRCQSHPRKPTCPPGPMWFCLDLFWFVLQKFPTSTPRKLNFTKKEIAMNKFIERFWFCELYVQVEMVLERHIKLKSVLFNVVISILFVKKMTSLCIFTCRLV